MSYTAFPCNIPEKKPGYATLALETAWDEMYHRVSSRMQKLREVAKILAKDEDWVATAIQKVFADNGKLLFDQNGTLLLDGYDAKKIARLVKPMLPLVQWEPFARFPNAVAVVNCMFITTKEWELIRCMGFGGSDSAVVMGIHKYESSTERSLYYSKTDLAAEKPDDGRAFIFAFGHQREPLVIGTFCKKTGAKQLPCPFLFRHKDYPWMTANIDAVVQLPDGTLAVFEAKTTGEQNLAEWIKSPPVQYVRQPMQYMVVLNDDRVKCAYIGALLGNTEDQWFCHRIDRDPVQEQILIEREEEFFVSYIEPGIVPDFTGDTDKDLFAFFTYEKAPAAVTDGDVVDLTGDDDLLKTLQEQVEAATRYKEAQKTADELGTYARQLALSIYSSFETNAKKGVVYTDDGMMYEVGCRVMNKPKIDLDALRLLAPDIYDRVVTPNPIVCAPSVSYKKAPKKKAP